jgi:hypothetical protein
MPTWIRKTLVVMFTILTFGLVTPPQIIITDAKSTNSTKADTIENSENKTVVSDSITRSYISNDIFYREDFAHYAMTQAEKQALKKFGPVIEKNIGAEFREVILPKIEEVIMTLSYSVEEARLQNLVISRHPTGGTSEKIFHIYDGETNMDLIRFHVRRDHPPLDGYYFNFHYHTFQDDFQTHHELGSIYWSKNTPPNWQVS